MSDDWPVIEATAGSCMVALAGRRLTPACDKKRFCFQTQKLLCFDTCTLPEAEILGIRSFFRDLSFEQHPRPWKGAREPKIEVSGTKNKNIFNRVRLGCGDRCCDAKLYMRVKRRDSA